MGFARFMAGTAGRAIRVIAGIALIVVGLFVVANPTWSIVLAVVGVVPLAAGLLDVCLFAPLFGGPFQGKQARQS